MNNDPYKWEVNEDGYHTVIKLPKTLNQPIYIKQEVRDDIDDDIEELITDKLSDKYGYCINGIDDIKKVEDGLYHVSGIDWDTSDEDDLPSQKWDDPDDEDYDPETSVSLKDYERTRDEQAEYELPTECDVEVYPEELEHYTNIEEWMYENEQISAFYHCLEAVFEHNEKSAIVEAYPMSKSSYPIELVQIKTGNLEGQYHLIIDEPNTNIHVICSREKMEELYDKMNSLLII